MTSTARLLLALLAGAVPMPAPAQVYRCADAIGKVQYSDKPCASDQKSGEVRIMQADPSPAPAPRMSAEASAREKERQRQRQDSDESQRRVDEATAKVQQMRAENHDPAKCAEARRRMAFMEQRDPLLYKINVDWVDFSQKARLYCGS